MMISTIDLKFKGIKGQIATYLLQNSNGAILVDPGPESTLPTLTIALKEYGLVPQDVTHILLTHIHFDHAGAAGWFALQGAQVYVHPTGAPHLLDPEKLITSAARLYGDQMNTLWGGMKPTPAARLVEVQDSHEISVGNIQIQALHTPGHAEHHVSYIFNDILFSGDAGGVRYEPYSYVRLPFVPPETHLEKWRASLERMKRTGCAHIAPTHFGIFDDCEAHLTRALCYLDEVVFWMEQNMGNIPDLGTMNLCFRDFLQLQGLKAGLDYAALELYAGGSPVNFAASGLFRYWNKVLNGI